MNQLLTDDEIAKLAESHQKAMTDSEILSHFPWFDFPGGIEEARKIVTNLIYDDLRDEFLGIDDVSEVI